MLPLYESLPLSLYLFPIYSLKHLLLPDIICLSSPMPRCMKAESFTLFVPDNSTLDSIWPMWALCKHLLSECMDSSFLSFGIMSAKNITESYTVRVPIKLRCPGLGVPLNCLSLPCSKFATEWTSEA